MFNRILYSFFIMSMLYAGSYLPCGKFFTLLKGNIATMLSFIVIYFYMLTNIQYFFSKICNFEKNSKLNNIVAAYEK